MKELKKHTFEELVTFIAGDALEKLLKGTNFRSIIWAACELAIRWSKEVDALARKAGAHETAHKKKAAR